MFKTLGSKMVNTPAVILAFLVFVGLFAASCVIMAADYWTSFLSYQSWPTQMAWPWLGYFVAALPQLVQIGAIIGMAIDPNMRLLGVFGAGALITDITTDAWYKSYGFESVSLTLVGFGEAIIIYSVFSEYMAWLSFTMVLFLLPYVIHQIGDLAEGLSTSIQNVTGTDRIGKHTPIPPYIEVHGGAKRIPGNGNGRPQTGRPQGRPELLSLDDD